MALPRPGEVVLLGFGAVVLGLCLELAAKFPSSDFLGFYAGAKLAGTREIYDAAAVERMEQTYGRLDRAKPFHRPPFYTLALAPLAQLPYRRAFGLWQALNVAALGAFLWLWPFADRTRAAILTLWFAPLWMAIGLAQDTGLVLASLAAAARLLDRKRPVAAGLALAACSFKPNLLLGVALVLAARRMWKVCAGAAAGGAAIYLISAAVYGPGWPLDYVAALGRTSQLLGPQTNFANLAGLAQSLPEALRWIRWPATALAAGVLLAVCRKATAVAALALALMAGLLITPFAFFYDAAVMLPGIAAAARGRPWRLLAAAALGLAALVITEPATAWIGQCCLIGLYAGAVRAALRGTL